MTQAPAELLLAATGLSKTMRGRKVLKEVAIEVGSREVVGLLGANGAGKTTAFYILAGLLRADTGRILLTGKDATILPIEKRLPLGVGFLPQENSIFANLSVRDNLRAVLQIRGLDRHEIDRRANRLLAQFGIEHLASHEAAVLSGGERRRLEIARTLAGEPTLLLLDEPFAGLDPITVGELQTVIKKLRTDNNIAFLISDHNVRETLSICDRAYILHEGSIIAQGSPAQITSNRMVREHYLGEHFTL